jgi:hypothetical protein
LITTTGPLALDELPVSGLAAGPGFGLTALVVVTAGGVVLGPVEATADGAAEGAVLADGVVPDVAAALWEP